MAKIGTSSMSFKIFEVPEEVNRENHRKLTGKYDIRDTSLERSFSDLGTKKRSSRITHFPRRTNSEDSSEATASTTTPENLKVLSVVPNAPAKPPRTSKKVDMRPKRLQFVEEAESPSSTNSSVNCSRPTHDCPMEASRRKIPENYESNSSKGKPQQSSRSNNRKNCPGADKENDQSLINGRQIEPSYLKPPRQSSKMSQDQKNTSKLKTSKNQFRAEETDDSEEESSYHWKDKLKWLRTHREVGLWIQCCRKSCRKWRFVQDIHDPTDAPEIWYCNMQTASPSASCDHPEMKIPRSVKTSVVRNKYNAGSIVWARLQGNPWRPAMVDDCPFTFCFYKLKSKSAVPVKYNVTYFSDDSVQSSWIYVEDLRPYKINPKEEFLKRKKLKFPGTDYKRQVYRACELADEALSLSISERLEKFSFGSRWGTSAATSSRNGSTSTSTSQAKEDEVLSAVQSRGELSSIEQSFSSSNKLFDSIIPTAQLHSRRFSKECRFSAKNPPDSQLSNTPSENIDSESSFVNDALSQLSSDTVLSPVNTQSSGRSERNIKKERSVNLDEMTEPSSKKHLPSDRDESPISPCKEWSTSGDENGNLAIRTDGHKFTFDQLLDYCTSYNGPRV